MIPGMKKLGAMKDIEPDGKEVTKIIAIIDSMTLKERLNYQIIDGQRRKRIARGSGTTVQDVNRLLKSYVDIRKIMKKMTGKGALKKMKRGLFPF
jgi:signal recognition particle subunit SRP54